MTWSLEIWDQKGESTIDFECYVKNCACTCVYLYLCLYALPSLIFDDSSITVLRVLQTGKQRLVHTAMHSVNT